MMAFEARPAVSGAKTGSLALVTAALLATTTLSHAKPVMLESMAQIRPRVATLIDDTFPVRTFLAAVDTTTAGKAVEMQLGFG